MADTAVLIAAWARTAVAPHGGAFRTLAPHDLGAPLVHALLARSGLAADAVDAVVLGNALGAGGNPARMVALAAGLPDRCAAYSVDTQCCAGLDAVALGAGLIASGQARVVVAGGAEAWSRAPIRQHRPLHPGEAPVSYERPAFAPDPARDPDLLQAAADYAAAHGVSRSVQDQFAAESHARALAQRLRMTAEIVPVAGLAHDAYPRAMSAASAARLPVQARSSLQPEDMDCAVSTLAISTRADGAALVLLVAADAARELGLHAPARWVGSASTGVDPAMPLLAAEAATRRLMARHGLADLRTLRAVELHDAFAVQGLAYQQACTALDLLDGALNPCGGGIARGHPIGASGAIALVRLLADLQHTNEAGAQGLAAVAGAGGIGAATLVQWLSVDVHRA